MNTPVIPAELLRPRGWYIRRVFEAHSGRWIAEVNFAHTPDEEGPRHFGRIVGRSQAEAIARANNWIAGQVSEGKWTDISAHAAIASLITAEFLRSIPSGDPIAHRFFELAADKVDQLSAEIGRLKAWLEYIAGRFGHADENAASALQGEPPPGGFGR